MYMTFEATGKAIVGAHIDTHTEVYEQAMSEVNEEIDDWKIISFSMEINEKGSKPAYEWEVEGEVLP